MRSRTFTCTFAMTLFAALAICLALRKDPPNPHPLRKEQALSRSTSQARVQARAKAPLLSTGIPNPAMIGLGMLRGIGGWGPPGLRRLGDATEPPK